MANVSCRTVRALLSAAIADADTPYNVTMILFACMSSMVTELKSRVIEVVVLSDEEELDPTLV